ncbi:LytR C-terminal domain-containing protein [Candidatus Uhrbacteria bacterium]|nr:LytR C-terminal domain-containing protein [Candidatus Uhrbacteria bacterium]
MPLKQEEIISQLKSLRQRLAGPGLFNGAYAVLMLMMLAAISFGAIRFLAFSARMLNQVTEVSAEIAGSEASGFDIPTLIRLAPRLGIEIPDLEASDAEPKPEPAAVPAPTPAAPPVEVPIEPTPPPVELDVGTLRISLLNGTGVSGLAKQWKEKFVQAGFVAIETGNAGSKEHREFLIRYQPQKKAYLERVRQVIVGNGGKVGSETEDALLTEDFAIIAGTP